MAPRRPKEPTVIPAAASSRICPQSMQGKGAPKTACSSPMKSAGTKNAAEYPRSAKRGRTVSAPSRNPPSKVRETARGRNGASPFIWAIIRSSGITSRPISPSRSRWARKASFVIP